MKRLSILITLAFCLVCFTGCTESPKLVVKRYVESARAGNASKAKQYYASGAAQSCNTYKRVG
jgi:hypothetical protein